MNQSSKSGVHLYPDALWDIQGVFTRLVELGERTVETLVSSIAPVFEYLMVGIGLGVLGAALVGCAIPILLCISHLH